MLDETPAATVEEVPGSPEKPQYGNIRVEDLDTPEYSEEQMQEFTAMYDESFSGKNEGEIVQGRVVGIHPQEVLVDIGFKSEGAISIREFSDPEAIAIGNEVGGLPRERRRPRGPRRALEAEGGLHARLERDQGLPRRRHDGKGKADATDQGGHRRRPFRGRGLPARFADRHTAGQELRPVPRPAVRFQDHQAQQDAPQHRRLAPRRARGRARAAAPGNHQGARRGTGARRGGKEHHRFRRLHRPGGHRRPAAHHRHVVGPRQPSLRDGLDRRPHQGQGPQLRPRARAHLPRAKSS